MGIHEPFVYFQPPAAWNRVMHYGIDSLADGGLDAIIFQADQSFPTSGENSVIPLIGKLSDKGVVTVIQPKERINGEGVHRAVEAGAISLGWNEDRPLDLVAKIAGIIKANPTVDGRRRAISKTLYRDIDTSSFWKPTADTDYRLGSRDTGKILP